MATPRGSFRGSGQTKRDTRFSSKFQPKNKAGVSTRMGTGMYTGKIAVKFRSLEKLFIKTQEDLISKQGKVETAVREHLKKVITKAIQQTKVYKNLANPSGEKGLDLGAEFGLRPELVKRALIELIKILHDTIEVKTSVTKMRGMPTHFKMVLNAKLLEPKKYYAPLTKNRPFFYVGTPKIRSRKKFRKKVFRDLAQVYKSQYGKMRKKMGISGKLTPLEKKKISQATTERLKTLRSTVKADWMKWILEANRGLNAMTKSRGFANVRDYAIVYTKGNRRSSGFSRSGRAVMRQAGTGSFFVEAIHGRGVNRSERKGGEEESTIGRLYKKGSYRFPRGARPKRGRNFIEEVISDPRFRQVLKNSTKRVVQMTLKKA